MNHCVSDERVIISFVFQDRNQSYGFLQQTLDKSPVVGPYCVNADFKQCVENGRNEK